MKSKNLLNKFVGFKKAVWGQLPHFLSCSLCLGGDEVGVESVPSSKGTRYGKPFVNFLFELRLSASGIKNSAAPRIVPFHC